MPLLILILLVMVLPLTGRHRSSKEFRLRGLSLVIFGPEEYVQIDSKISSQTGNRYFRSVDKNVRTFELFLTIWNEKHTDELQTYPWLSDNPALTS